MVRRGNTMKIKCFLLSLFLVSGDVFAESIPSIQLHMGENEVTLNYSNSWIMDIRNAKVLIDSQKLPVWLDIKTESSAVTIPVGSKSALLKFVIYVRNVPNDETSTVIPYIIQDSEGNIWKQGLRVFIGGDIRPYRYELSNNVPNPFNSTTTIQFTLENKERTSLYIYNSVGQLVRKLVNASYHPGSYVVVWNGCDDNGRRVSSGVYFYKLNAGSFSSIKKMALLQ